MTALRLFDGDGQAARQDPPPPQLTHEPVSDRDLNIRGKLTLWALTKWAWGKKPDCWPSNGQLARHMGCSPSTAQRGLRDLEAQGYIVRKMVPDDNGWRRVLIITSRVPTLGIHQGDEVTGPFESDQTPRAEVTTPPRSDLHTEGSKGGKREDSKPATTPTARGGPSSSRRDTEPEPAPEPSRPPTDDEREFWRAVLEGRATIPQGHSPALTKLEAIGILALYDRAWFQEWQARKRPAGGRGANLTPQPSRGTSGPKSGSVNSTGQTTGGQDDSPKDGQ